MERYIWINPDRLLKAHSKETVEGIDLIVELSPYDAPKAIVGKYEKETGCFLITFEYIDKEAGTSNSYDEGITVSRGKHSGKLLGISMQVNQLPLDKAAIIHLRTIVRKALDQMESEPGKGHLNHRIAKQLLDEDLEKLVAMK